jgi:hypothetical protein
VLRASGLGFRVCHFAFRDKGVSMHSPSYGKAAEKRAKGHSRPTQEPRLLRHFVVCHVRQHSAIRERAGGGRGGGGAGGPARARAREAERETHTHVHARRARTRRKTHTRMAISRRYRARQARDRRETHTRKHTHTHTHTRDRPGTYTNILTHTLLKVKITRILYI